MRIGLKLDVDFDTNEAYQRLFSGRDVPTRLRELGVQAVEFPLGPSSDLGEVGLIVRRCREVGVRVSFHPYTEGHAANPAYFDGPESQPARVHQRLLRLAGCVASEQGETIVNIHPAAAFDGNARRELMERSVYFFSWARDWCAEHAPHVRPVVELQVSPEPSEPLIRIADSPSELAEIVERSGVAACWDVGHAAWNHQRFDIPDDPPDALWERIAHVHCHDVDDLDHRVLRRGDAHWRRFLQRLSGTDYAGTVVMEVSPQTFLDAGGLTALEESINAVSEAAA